MRELHLQLSLELESLVLLVVQFGYLLLRDGSHPVLGQIVGLCMNQIQCLQSLSIHIFNITDVQ